MSLCPFLSLPGQMNSAQSVVQAFAHLFETHLPAVQVLSGG